MCTKIGFFGSVIRFLLGIINGIFLLLGFAIFLSAAILRWNSNSIINKINNDAAKNILNFSVLDNVSLTFIIIGAFIIVVSLLGLFGIIFTNRFLLVIYEIIICSLFLAHVIILLYAVIKSSSLETELRKSLNQTIERINDNSMSPDMQKEDCDALKFLSQLFECCGANNLNDFTNKTMIEMCCVQNTTNGCSDKIISTVKTDGANIIIIPNAVILLFEFLILISVPLLISRVSRLVKTRRDEEDESYVRPTTQAKKYGSIQVNSIKKYQTLKEF